MSDLAEPRPPVLVCAGLDPSGGAGFIADVRVVHLLGGRPIGAITAQTVQNTAGLRSIHEVDADVLDVQLNALLTDIEIKAIKLGMLGGPDIVRVLDAAFAMTQAPLVWDPIAAPTHGAATVPREALDQAMSRLAAHLTLITPNGPELAVLLKGGHLIAPEADEVVDVLIHDGGKQERFVGPRIAGASVHGTGCALSSAIATYLALGHSLVEACRAAKLFVAAHLARPVTPGRGAPAIL